MKRKLGTSIPPLLPSQHHQLQRALGVIRPTRLPFTTAAQNRQLNGLLHPNTKRNINHRMKHSTRPKNPRPGLRPTTQTWPIPQTQPTRYPHPLILTLTTYLLATLETTHRLKTLPRKEGMKSHVTGTRFEDSQSYFLQVESNFHNQRFLDVGFAQ